jgi:hypothetical protein
MILRTSRRRFVRGAAAAAVAGPFLRLLERPTFAATPPRRLIVVVTPVAPIRSSYAADTQDKILEALKPFQSKLIVMRGIDNRAGSLLPLRDHATDFPSLLTGRHPLLRDKSVGMNGQSIENYIGARVQAQFGTARGAYYLGVRPRLAEQQGSLPLFSSGTGRTIAPKDDPIQAFNELFSNIPTGPIAGPSTPSKSDQEKKLILDSLTGELNAIKCQLGGDERVKFDAHLDALASLHKTLNAGPGAGLIPAVCSGRVSPPARDWASVAEFQNAIRTQMDNAAMAMACDVTRVIGMQLDRNGSDIAFPATLVPGIPQTSHHGIAHAGGNDAQMALIDQFYARQVAYLVGKLDTIEIPDGGGKLLDHTAVVWLHEQGRGNNHSRFDHAAVIAGGLGGYFLTNKKHHFKTGITPETNQNMVTNQVQEGEPLPRLLMNLAEGMGVPLAADNPFGDIDMPPAERAFFAKGPIEALRTAG